MKSSLRNENLNALLENKKISQMLVFVLALIILILSVLLFFREEKWVLIPQYETAHRVIVTSDGYSDEYIQDLVGNSLKHLLSVNPNTVDREVKLFSEFTGDTQFLNVFLKRHAKYIKENDALTAFYPKKFTAHDGYMLVEGEMFHRFGQKKDWVQQQKTLKVSYEVGSKGLLIILSIEELK